MMFVSIVYAFASAYYYATSKGALAAFGLILSVLLLLVAMFAVIFSEVRPRWARLTLVFGCIIVVTALAGGMLRCDTLAHSTRQLFYAAVPLMGHLVSFVLQLLQPVQNDSEKNVEKVSANG